MYHKLRVHCMRTHTLCADNMCMTINQLTLAHLNLLYFWKAFHSVKVVLVLSVVNMHNSGVAKPRHTRARARATFACTLAFACQSFKLAPCVNESARNRKRRGSDTLSTSKSFLENWIATRALPEYWRCVLFSLHSLGLKTQQMPSRRS